MTSDEPRKRPGVARRVIVAAAILLLLAAAVWLDHRLMRRRNQDFGLLNGVRFAMGGCALLMIATGALIWRNGILWVMGRRIEVGAAPEVRTLFSATLTQTKLCLAITVFALAESIWLEKWIETYHYYWHEIPVAPTVAAVHSITGVLIFLLLALVARGVALVWALRRNVAAAAVNSPVHPTTTPAPRAEALPLQKEPRTRLGPAPMRLVVCLGLIPIIFTLAAWLGQWGEDWLNRRTTWPVDTTHLANFFVAFLTVGAGLLIWRNFIAWTLGRKALTAIVAWVPFLQVIYAQSLWNTGCSVTDKVLRFSQGQIGMGLWVWLNVWVWWGWERFGVWDRPIQGGRVMKENGSRILASMGTFPLTVGVFFIVVMALGDIWDLDGMDSTCLGYATAAIVFIASWALIWRGRVVWNGAVLLKTVNHTLLWLGYPIGAIPLLGDWVAGSWEMILGLAPLVGWGIWIMVMARLWPHRLSQGAAVELEALTCARCGYSLRGLTHTRCPECGHEPTLDQLWTQAHENEL